nr:MAG TPA: head closure knob [Bacteriophage sp.]
MLPKIPLVRRSVERLYDGVATVEEARKEKNAKNITALIWAVVAQDLPCRVSYKTLAPAGRSDTVDSIAQAITLFTAPEIDIKPGSRVTVTQRGRTMRFACSGIPAVYDSHQEIPLVRFEEHP